MAASKAEVEISRATWLPNRSAFAKILVRNINTKPNKQTIIELTARCHEAAAKFWDDTMVLCMLLKLVEHLEVLFVN